ncbi:MAG: hypothetical protein K6F64_01230 [Clostridia bacterium]|nr:hypothetical protein [Clostridia bacterium]
MKKLFVILLCFSLAMTGSVFARAEQTAYPESRHNYENNSDISWTYTHPDEAQSLFVTFGEGYLSSDEKDTDSITLTALEGRFSRTFYGDSLSGTTVYIPDGSFDIRLKTDSKGTGYGFKITDISTGLPEGQALIKYNLGDDSVYDVVNLNGKDSAEVTFNEIPAFTINGRNEALIGWKTETGEARYYLDEKNFGAVSETITVSKNETVDLYPVYTPVSIAPSEYYSFRNSGSNFRVNGDEYYMNILHILRLYMDWMFNLAVNPKLFLESFENLIAVTLNITGKWKGSCYGLCATVILQHFKMIDLLSSQGASSVSELKLDNDLMSTINYYQITQFATKYAENESNKGSSRYNDGIDEMFDSAKAGKPVLLSVYTPAINHTVILSGAYTASDSRRLLIIVDPNRAEYQNGRAAVIGIDADKSDFSFEGNIINKYYWADDFDYFNSFIPGKSINPKPFWAKLSS